MTVVKCAVGVGVSLCKGAGLHHRSALCPIFLTTKMDKLLRSFICLHMTLSSAH